MSRRGGGKSHKRRPQRLQPLPHGLQHPEPPPSPRLDLQPPPLLDDAKLRSGAGQDVVDRHFFSLNVISRMTGVVANPKITYTPWEAIEYDVVKDWRQIR